MDRCGAAKNSMGEPVLAQRIGTGLAHLAQGMRGRLWQEARALGLTPTQAQALLALHSASVPPTVGELAEQFGNSPATISEVLSGLERKALVERRHCTQDRRVVRILLTCAGVETADQLVGWHGLLGDVIANLAPQDRESFYRTLLTLLAALERDGLVSAHQCLTCAFFRADCGENPDQPHNCSFSNLRLRDTELRLDCPDFQVHAGATR